MNQEQPTKDRTASMTEISTRDIIQYLKLSCQMPNVLQGLVSQKLIEQAATERKISLTEEEIQTAADLFRFENNLISSENTLRWLENYHLSVTEFEELIKNTLLKQKLARHLFAEQVEPYFYSHQSDFNQAIIHEIVFKDFNIAMELYYSIQEQEIGFWDVAHQYIEDSELRRRGGYMGKKTREQLPPEIAAAVFAIADTALPLVLKPMVVDKYTHLIYVEEIIKPTLNEPLQKKIIDRLFNNWLKRQLQQVIELKDLPHVK